MPEQSYPLSSELVVLAARLVREVRRNNADTPAASTRLLSLLDEVGPTTVSALAAADRCAQPTMTGLVRGLLDRGWANRSPHPEDSRASLIELSVEGHAELARIRHRNAAVVAERLARTGHTQEDLITTVAVLRDLLPQEDS